MPANRKAKQVGMSLRVRGLVFAVVTLAVVGAALWLVRPSSQSSDAVQVVQVTMGGFQPAEIHLPANQPATIRLVNQDSPYHTDGGGVHQFAAPTIGVDVRVQTRSSEVVNLPALAPGTYEFYCDVCCGGKENPSMWGKLVVT
jgi:cytochrome c oxidase subunit 2